MVKKIGSGDGVSADPAVHSRDRYRPLSSLSHDMSGGVSPLKVGCYDLLESQAAVTVT
jgi:hypothetical protein